MTYEDFETLLREQLKKEKEASINAANFLYSPDGASFVDDLKKKARVEMSAILSEISDIEAEKIDAYRKWQSGESTESDYRKIETSCSLRYEELDAKLNEIISEVNEIEKTYSDKNPWIRMFRRIDTSMELNKVNMKKILDGLYVYRFESVEIVPKELEWKNRLPEEWLEARDGKGK